MSETFMLGTWCLFTVLPPCIQEREERVFFLTNQITKQNNQPNKPHQTQPTNPKNHKTKTKQKLTWIQTGNPEPYTVIRSPSSEITPCQEAQYTIVACFPHSSNKIRTCFAEAKFYHLQSRQHHPGLWATPLESKDTKILLHASGRIGPSLEVQAIEDWLLLLPNKCKWSFSGGRSMLLKIGLHLKTNKQTNKSEELVFQGCFCKQMTTFSRGEKGQLPPEFLSRWYWNTINQGQDWPFHLSGVHLKVI